MEAEKRTKAVRIFDKILNDIKPSKLEIEATTANVNRIVGELKRIVPKDVEIKVVGSIARGTELKGNSDIDIFLLFSKKLSSDKVTEYGIQYGKRLARNMGGKYEIRYAEHPYLRLYVSDIGVDVDIVPAYKIIDITEMGTTVDRTPLHNDFINANLTDRQKDEVRLLKFLLNNHSIYGAEVKTKGFSGYLCELLIYHYGSLLKLLEDLPKIKMPYYLNPLKPEEKGDKEIFEKFNSDFVVIDPVDPNRNVAAIVSHESLAKLVLIARMFTEKPSEKIFYGYKSSSKYAHQMLYRYMDKYRLAASLIVLKIPEKSEDIIWPQLKKLSGSIIDYISRNGFQVYIDVTATNGSEGIIFFISPRMLLGSRLLKGPDVLGNADAALSFIKAHSDANFVLNGSVLHVIEKAKHPNINDAIAAFIKSEIGKRHKDINLKSAKLLSTIPKKYAELLYSEFLAKTGI